MNPVTWTEAARGLFDERAARLRATLSKEGADADEVVDDWRRHIEEDARNRRLSAITREDVTHWLGVLAGDPEPADSLPPTRPGRSTRDLVRPGTAGLVLTALFGVVLPLITLVLELGTRMCTETFFDPLPTWWHVLLVASVPAANLWALLLLRQMRPAGRPVVVLNALAIGAATYYSLVFLPIAPFALVGIIFFGFGFLPLSPHLGLAAAIYLRRRLKRAAPDGLPRPRVPACVGLVLLSVFVLELPKISTFIGLHMTASEHVETRARGVEFLRRFGKKDMLLRGCYLNRRPVGDMFGFVYNMVGDPLSREEMQSVYYRVTGTPFNAVRPPPMRSVRGVALNNVDAWDFDQGGDAVAARVRGLSLQESVMDSAVYPAAGAGYTEWTVVFRNTSSLQREARARIQLPPGGVVSRLSLWIDGEPREAAFGSRNRVKTAYKKVVQRQRDPVLVTTCGPDQVLLQCFPVPPGGTMKTRIGITAPLRPQDGPGGHLRLPAFVEENFRIPDELRHSVWCDAPGPLATAAAALTATSDSNAQHAVRGRLRDPRLRAGVTVASTTPIAAVAFEPDTRAGTGETYVQQTRGQQPVVRPPLIVVVVDGSRRMASHAEALASALQAMKPGGEVALFLAGDRSVQLCDRAPAAPDHVAGLARALAGARYAGGCDNITALLNAWDLAATRPGSCILWVHATQPVELGSVTELEQRLQRRPDGPALFDIQCGDGPNIVANALWDHRGYHVVPQLTGPMPAVSGLLAEWQGTRARARFSRIRLNSRPADAVETDTGLHLARLWANDEVRRLLTSPADAAEAAATRLATTYQLVTPVSGAVVLETEAQYKEAGLEPVDGASTPAVVPEPETWALMLLGLALLVLCGRRPIPVPVRS